MWADDAEMAKAIAGQLVKLFRTPEHKNDAPQGEPPPFKPEKLKKNETYNEMLQRRLRDEVRAGRAVSMNALGRSIFKPKPPRAPGRQSRRFNGLWWHY